MRIDGDDVIRCGHCDEVFVVTLAEREFYTARTGHYNRPRFCRPCRIERREAMQAATVTRVHMSIQEENP